MQHSQYMHRCLELARRGRGRVGVNPMVGAVLVRDGTIIAEAWHREFGDLHAERMLFNNLDQKITEEDVLYVNLEPCFHHGKTPPCTDIILERGVRTVVYGMEDPHSAVQGKGAAALRAAGVRVIGPVERARCAWLNRGFVSLHTQGRPWITLKRAQARDGTTANADGSPRKITSQEQDAWAHARLRTTHDTILVGVGTVLSDDPQLTVRWSTDRNMQDGYSNTKFDQNKKVEQVNPLRIVLDPNLRIQKDARILAGECAQGTVVIAGSGRGSDAAQQSIQATGARVWECPLAGELFDWQALWALLTTPQEDFCGITSILVEGGTKTWQAFQAAGMVDAEVVLVGA